MRSLKKGDLVRHTALDKMDHLGIVMRIGHHPDTYCIHWLVLPPNVSHLLKWQPLYQLEKANEKLCDH